MKVMLNIKKERDYGGGGELIFIHSSYFCIYHQHHLRFSKSAHNRQFNLIVNIIIYVTLNQNHYYYYNIIQFEYKNDWLNWSEFYSYYYAYRTQVTNTNSYMLLHKAYNIMERLYMLLLSTTRVKHFYICKCSSF